MRITRGLVIGVMMALWGACTLAGCGTSEKPAPDQRPAGATTPRPPAPRNRALPGDPYTFEAPFSAGQFVRQTMTGSASSTPTGGLRATYHADGTDIALAAYYFATPEEAARTVQFALEAPGITGLVAAPYYSTAISFGIGQTRQGGYLAAWSHQEWCFLAQTTGGLDGLNAFLEAFPY